MTSTGSTAEEDYSYGHHRYEALSPHSATSTASPAVGPEGNEVNEVMENDVLCGRYVLNRASDFFSKISCA